MNSPTVAVDPASPPDPTSSVDPASPLDRADPRPGDRPPGPVPVLARGLSVSLSGTEILHGVDLTVPEGQVVALLGSNGSGKSTLVRALLGIVPSRGRLELFGRPPGPRAPWDRIGYVPQRSTASSGVPATVLEVTCSGLLSGRRLFLPRNSRARALAALDRLGIADLAERNVGELSGGQQQRVLIARALVREPTLLVLDEPTAGVDLAAQEAFVQTITALPGATVLVVLHEVGPFDRLLDRAVVLRSGRVVYDGAPPPARSAHDLPGHEHLHPHDDPPSPCLTPEIEVRP